jgi:hypothetical protein
MDDPTSSYATAGITLRVSGALKPYHRDEVETPSVGLLQLLLLLLLLLILLLPIYYEPSLMLLQVLLLYYISTTAGLLLHI